mgnify:CR=1 FL=1
MSVSGRTRSDLYFSSQQLMNASKMAIEVLVYAKMVNGKKMLTNIITLKSDLYNNVPKEQQTSHFYSIKSIIVWSKILHNQ